MAGDRRRSAIPGSSRSPAPLISCSIENADRTLDPRIFVDHGRGFTPEEEIELRQTRDGVYAVSLKSSGRVRRVRIDPASYPAEFGFRAFAAGDEKSACAYIGKKLRAAATGDRAAPTCEVVARGERTSSPASAPARLAFAALRNIMSKDRPRRLSLRRR